MTAGNNHFGKSDASFHPLGAVGEAHVKILVNHQQFPEFKEKPSNTGQT
jgi:hypothetical protein